MTLYNNNQTSFGGLTLLSASRGGRVFDYDENHTAVT